MTPLPHQNNKAPHLSVVVTSRNDNHGGGMLYRMQHFVTGFIEQCNQFQLNAELIIVEWNPPEENLPLEKVLTFSKRDGFCKVRIIKVPKELHRTFSHSDKLPLFQMIGKNVGIRRAEGNFILATNIDVLFSNELIRYMKNKLKPNISYRLDRLDVPKELPKFNSFKELLKFCDQNVLYINGRFGSHKPTDKLFAEEVQGSQKQNGISKAIKKCYSNNPFGFVKNLIKKTHKKVVQYLLARTPAKMARIPLFKGFLTKISQRFYPLNTNACGDFALMSASDWKRLKGYPEWPMYSWNLDGILVYQAERMGIQEVELSKPLYHIDHDGGFSVAKGFDELLQRLDAKGIPYVTNESTREYRQLIKNSKNEVVYNDDHWGLADYSLEETHIFC